MTDIKTPEGRAALRAICEAATGGPWESNYRNRCFEIRGPNNEAVAATGVWLAIETSEMGANGRFLATSRSALPACLDELDRQEAEIERTEARVAELEGALRDEAEAHPVLRTHPIGQEGSQARKRQEQQIAARDKSNAALATTHGDK